MGSASDPGLGLALCSVLDSEGKKLKILKNRLNTFKLNAKRQIKLARCKLISVNENQQKYQGGFKFYGKISWRVEESLEVSFLK